MKIIVQLTDHAASEFTRGSDASVFASRLNELLARHHSSLESMHPEVSDKTLQSYFTLTSPDIEHAEVLAKELRKTEGILAAYVKPEEQAP